MPTVVKKRRIIKKVKRKGKSRSRRLDDALKRLLRPDGRAPATRGRPRKKSFYNDWSDVIKSTDLKDAVSRGIDNIGGGPGLPPVDPKLYTMDDGVTQSLIHGFLACRRQIQLVLQGWRLPSTKSAMTYGSIFHDLLEQFYLAIIHKQISRKSNFRRFAIKHTKAWLKKHGKRLRHGGDLKMALEESAKVCAVFPAYCRAYPHDFTKIRWQELEGVFDLNWNGFRLRGRWDGLYKLAKEYWLLETKTKSQVNAEKLKEAIAFDFQSLFYITALTQHRGIPIEGVLYNVIRNPGLRQGSKEGDKAFMRRIAEDANDREDFYFMRFEATFPDETREQFERELLAILHEMKLWLEGKMFTFKNGGSCIRRFTCDYMTACSSGSMAGYRDKGELFTELL